MGNVSEEAIPGICSELIHQHGVYQLGSFILVIGLIVPCNVGLPQIIWLRIIFILSFLCYFLWGGIVMCWPDAFGWNLAAVIINLIQVLYMAYVSWEISLPEDFQYIYDALFADFKLNKRTFQRLMGNSAGAELYDLDATGKYATEGKNHCNKHLSLLMKGRLRVSNRGFFLHYIRPGQFIDSPEWNANDGSASRFQVTIQADTDCTYVRWPRSRLRNFLKNRHFLKTVMDTAIGKDVTNKLYSIGEEEVEPFLYVGVESETEIGDEKVQLLQEDQLFSHRWERATSVDIGQGGARGSFRTPSSPKSATGNFLTVPRSEDMGSSSSLRRRSLMDIRASMASGKGPNNEKRRSRLSSEEASGVFLTPPQSARGSFRNSPDRPGSGVEIQIPLTQ